VLLPISRYSTFVKHSAADLAEAFIAMGHDARVLTEPDDHSRLASPAYLRAFAEFRPDLVVLINYTRHHMGQAIVPGVPVVCWIQDAMPHLFNPQAGAAQGELDFLAGYLPTELFDRFAYPRARTLFSPVTASATKFHPTPPSADDVQRMTCEIAYVSHQSEAPDVFCERMIAAAPANTPARRAVEGAGAGVACP
jgi:hypothetical protein